MTTSPDGIQKYEPYYKTKAWESYTLAELGWWVHLFARRAEHRSVPDKRAKDLADAKNYLAMMAAKLEALEAARPSDVPE